MAALLVLALCWLPAVGNAQTEPGIVVPVPPGPGDGTGESHQLPRLTEEEAKAIATAEPSVAAVIRQHPELERQAAYDSIGRVWTVFWTLPGNPRRLITVEVSDASGGILYSRIEYEAYLDAVPSLSEQEAIDLARAQPRIQEELAGRETSPSATYGEDMVWTVGFFEDSDEVAQVLVDDGTGIVNEVRMGPQVAWQMARGYEGAFGRIVNEPYVWLPLCVLFIAPFFDVRRPLKVVHLDLIVMLSFTVSHYFFNMGEIFTSVPLAYPPLAYLFLRLGWIGMRRRRGSSQSSTLRLSGSMPHVNFGPRILLAGIIALIVFRLTINFADSNVVDVGYSGVIGADLIGQGKAPYGNMPSDNSNGDTYGPLNYLIYVPFEMALPWSGQWDALPAAHAAAIFFDLATVAGMFFAGRSLMRHRPDQRNILGIALAYAWLAYPYTAFVQNCNVNDTAVAAFLVWGFVFIERAPVAGAILGLATQIKFVPAIMGPLWASFPRAWRGWGRRMLFVLAFAVAVAVTLPVIFLGDGNFQTFWERSLKWQIGRDSPFSIWGLYPEALSGIQRVLQYMLVALAVVSYFLPSRKGLINVAAASAALVVGFQLVQTHWFYLYIVWFAPLALVALLAGHEARPAIDSQRRYTEDVARPASEPFSGASA